MRSRPRISEVLKLLERRYGLRRRGRTRRVLDEIMLALLARDLGEERDHTPSQTARRALERLDRHFVDWNHLRVARLYEVAQAIAPTLRHRSPRAEADEGRRKKRRAPVPGSPERNRKAERAARRVLAALRQIHAVHGILDLEEYTGMRPVEIRRLLDSVPAIGREGTGHLLLFAFRAPLLPVDGEILRVLTRTGIVPQGSQRAKAAHNLQEDLPSGRFYAAYRLLSEHAARTCTSAAPACRECPVRRTCPAARRLKKTV